MKADVNWFGVLAHHALRAPDRPITVFEGRATTYAEMEARAVALAGGLAERGVRQGDVVGLLAYNCPEFLQVIFAANYLGAIAMPINWRLAAAEVRYILEHSEARALGLRRSAGGAGQGGDRRPGDPRWCAPASRASRRADGPASPSSRPARGPVTTGARRNPTTSTASCTRPGRPVGPRA